MFCQIKYILEEFYKILLILLGDYMQLLNLSIDRIIIHQVLPKG
jgi:hypothetical protein